MPLPWKRVIDSQAEKLKELDKEIRPFRQNWEEADSMKSSVESLQNRVTELESVDKSSGQAARNTGEGGRAGAGLGGTRDRRQVLRLQPVGCVVRWAHRASRVQGSVCHADGLSAPQCLWRGTRPLGLPEAGTVGAAGHQP